MQETNKLELNEKSLRTELKGYQKESLKALAEYIWNSFDAGAKNVRILFKKPAGGIGIIDNVTIVDDGDGWDFSENETKNFLSSNKADIDNQNKTLPHGKLGRGRYTFIWFADYLEVKSRGQKMILRKDSTIDAIETSSINLGTEVRLVNINSSLSQYLDTDALKYFLSLEFGWFLKGDKNLKIHINDEVLDYSGNIVNEFILTKDDLGDEIKEFLGTTTIDTKIVIWKEKPKEYSKFFIFKNTDTHELFTKTTGFNRKSDGFYHSVYIYSDIFEEDDKGAFEEEDSQQLTLEISANRKLKKKVFEALKKELSNIRRPILQEKSKEVILNLHIEDSIPRLEEYGVYDNEGFDSLLEEAYVIAPSLFTGKGPQERLFVCTAFAALLSSQDSNLIKKILEQVFGLEDEDKIKLGELLDRTNLSNIVRTAAEIQGRLDTLTDLETLLFKFEKETLEVKHLQQILNENPWIFGEQFRLFTNTEGALKDTLHKYAKEVLCIAEPDIESASRKELDFFLVKTYPEDEKIRKNIIVEIKRPRIVLGKTEYDQIEKYADDILQESICNDGTTMWEFYLIGDDYNEYIERKIEIARNFGEKHKGLTDNSLDGRRKIYVRKWSEIIGVEHKHKMNYLQEKLNLNKKDTSNDTPDSIIQSLSQKSIGVPVGNI